MKILFFIKNNRFLLIIVLLAVLLRLPNFTSRSLWFDEASSWQTASFSLPDMLQSLRLSVHMPLYYLTLKAWMFLLGDSIASLRGLSLFFGILTVVGMYHFGRELYRFMNTPLPPQEDDVWRISKETGSGGEMLGVVLAALVAISPFQILASIETRMYALGTFLTATGGCFLLRFLRRGGIGSDAIALTIVILLSSYTHNYLIFTVFSYFLIIFFYSLYLVVKGERGWAVRLISRGTAIGAVTIALFLPWLNILLTQTRRVQQDYWIRPIDWGTLPSTFLMFVVPSYGTELRGELWTMAGWSILEAIAIAVLLLMLTPRLWRGVAVVVALAVIPLICSALISLLSTPIWHIRYFRFCHLYILSIIGFSLWHVCTSSKFPRRSLLILSVPILSLLFIANIYFWNSMELPERQGARRVVEKILASENDSKMIVAFDYRLYFPIKYYARSQMECRLLEVQNGGQWGPHLIRPEDIIRGDKLEESLRDGVWVISDSPNLGLAIQSGSINTRHQFIIKNYTMRYLDFHVNYVKINQNMAVNQ
jgi:mannosyltransferase